MINLDKSGIYTQRHKDCFEISAGNGEFVYELLGKTNGDCKQLSVARVNILAKGFSQAHRHPKKEESYVITEGQGLMVRNGVPSIISAGDVMCIPIDVVHQITTIGETTLKFFCICANKWTVKGFVPAKMPEKKDEQFAPSRKKEDCTPIVSAPGVLEYELLSKKYGKAEKHSVTLIEIDQGGSLPLRYLPKFDQSFAIVEGSGILEIDNVGKIVSKGDVAKIPAGQVHRISNISKGVLKLYCIAADAEAQEHYVKV